MLRTVTSMLLASTLIVAGGIARAADTEDKVKEGAKHAGKTAAHGATAAGKQGSRLYHTTASRVHREIAKRSGNPNKKTKHLNKADIHRSHAQRKAGQTERELREAGREADKVAR
jgi:hypothetical protein